MKRKEIQYGIPNNVENGITEILLPYRTPLKPLVKAKYAKQWGTYPVEDSSYGCNCYVVEDYDTEAKVKYKKLYTNVPPEILKCMFDWDREETLYLRYQDENTDSRPVESYTDDNGDWHNGVWEEASYQEYKRSCEEDEPDVFDESVLHGALSDNPRIRNAQIRDMSEIIRATLSQRTPTLCQTFEALFYQCRQEVDIAEEEGVGKSAVSNRKNRLISDITKALIANGYTVPTKAELKAEKQAAQAREDRLEQSMSIQRADERDRALAHRLTALFYQEGFVDQATMEKIEKEIEDAA